MKITNNVLFHFQQYHNVDVTLPVDQVSQIAVLVVRHLNLALATARSAIMIDDVVLSVKFFFGKYSLITQTFKKKIC